MIARLEIGGDFERFRGTPPGPFGILISLIVFGVINLIWHSLEPYFYSTLDTFLPFLRATLSSALFELLFVFVIVCLAIGLYLLRSLRPRTYASLEIIVGLIVSVHAANSIYIAAPTVQDLFTILGGLYLIIRGTDNWSKKQHDNIPTPQHRPSSMRY
jgi:hypothetical protein